MLLRGASVAPFSDVDYVGLAIAQVNERQNHCGFLVRLDNGQPRIVHLGSHYCLRDEKPSREYGWVDLPLPQSEKRVLSVLVDNIAKHNPATIPYALDFIGVHFDQDTGKIVTPPPGKGMTCATFIVVVLAEHGHQLVLLETWPTEEDTTWQEWVVGWLRRQGAAAAHIETVKADVGCRRLKPEQVVGAATYEEWPVEYEDASKAAAQIIAELADIA